MKKYDVFVSYRRDGGEALACLLSERLRQKEYSVFYDVESLRSGKFNEKIYNVIDECQDVVIVLPPNGLERCKNEEDWVRKEIAYAIQKEKNIIPIMMRNFEFPLELPEDIKDLPNFNGITANMEFFDAVFEKLIEMLKSRGTVGKNNFAEYIKDESIQREVQYWTGEVKTKNSAEARYQLANCLYQKVKNEALNDEIFRLCKGAAEEGYAEAQKLLGNCYDEGIGTKKDLLKAFHWFQMAAEQGVSAAQYNLALLFKEDGKKLSAYWMEQAAKQEDPDAIFEMGKCYEYGIGRERNWEKSNEYYQKAADLGHKSAKRKMISAIKMMRRVGYIIEYMEP